MGDDCFSLFCSRIVTARFVDLVSLIMDLRGTGSELAIFAYRALRNRIDFGLGPCGLHWRKSATQLRPGGEDTAPDAGHEDQGGDAARDQPADARQEDRALRANREVTASEGALPAARAHAARLGPAALAFEGSFKCPRTNRTISSIASVASGNIGARSG